MNVFAYGTLAWNDRQLILCRKTFPMSPAVLEDFRLDEPPGCYRMIYPQPGARVEGTLIHQVSTADLIAFDRWEEEGDLYQRIEVTAITAEERVRCWAYQGLGKRARR